jgi:uncharacterized protein YwgA
MNRLKKGAILLSLIDKLQEHDSWCGETHIQKTAYFLRELLRVPLDYEFVLHKHGPYSFDLTKDLTSLRADMILDIEVRDERYGPSYVTGSLGDFLRTKYPITTERYREQIEFVANHLGNKGVKDLERLATALYVRQRSGDESVPSRARQLTRIKPHIDLDDARAATDAVDAMIEEAEENGVVVEDLR